MLYLSLKLHKMSCWELLQLWQSVVFGLFPKEARQKVVVRCILFVNLT